MWHNTLMRRGHLWFITLTVLLSYVLVSTTALAEDGLKPDAIVIQGDSLPQAKQIDASIDENVRTKEDIVDPMDSIEQAPAIKEVPNTPDHNSLGDVEDDCITQSDTTNPVVKEIVGTGKAVEHYLGQTTSPDIYYDTSWDVVVELISGVVKWDATTRTLTLRNATIGYISANASVTINLSGKNTVEDIVTITTYGDIDIVIEGTGSLLIKDTDYGISCSNLKIVEGTISIDAPTFAGIELTDGDFEMCGGKLNIANSFDYGISIYGGNFTMTGGILEIADSESTAISVMSRTYRGVTTGGRIAIEGGSLTATCKDVEYPITYADETSIKAQCLKKCQGWLSPGTFFITNGNEYKRVSTDCSTDYLGNYHTGHNDSVTLVRYGNASGYTPPTTISFGGNKYLVSSIEGSAYGTDGLHKVSQVKISNIPTKSYTGKAIKPSPKLTFGGKSLVNGTDYKLTYSRNVHAGVANITIRGKGRYVGTKRVSFTILKAKQPMRLKAKKLTAKLSVAKNKATTIDAPFTFIKKAKGAVTYTKVSGSKCLAIGKKTGKITIKQGTKKGKYVIRVKVQAKGNADYKSGQKLLTCEITVKA